VTERLAILADDLTGAADAGAPFAAMGRPTVVLLSPDAPATPAGADVLVLTSESRTLRPAEAMDTTQRCARRIVEWRRGDASARVYKKIDSTLRGHPALELRVLMDTLGARAALVAPAFPAQGRTTVRGRQCVNGMPLERTTFAREGATSDLVALFTPLADGAVGVLTRADLQRGAEYLAGRLRHEREVSLWIADAEDESDLSVLAAAAFASPLRVLCGSAGLARAMARADGPGPIVTRAVPAEPPVLVVAGSRHAATAAQVESLRRSGTVVVRPKIAFLESGDPSAAARTVARVADVMATGRSVVLSITGLPEVPAHSMAIATRLASIVAGVCDRVRVGALVLTGGDTASAVCGALGSVSLSLTGELEPAIATGMLIGGRHPGTPVVTKAGGFGDDEALGRAMACLRGTPL
jgi:uncharacterized protein YgbK (DUF1537 family)